MLPSLRTVSNPLLLVLGVWHGRFCLNYRKWDPKYYKDKEWNQQCPEKEETQLESVYKFVNVMLELCYVIN